MRDEFRTTPPTVRSHATRTRIQLCLYRRARRPRRGPFSFTSSSLVSDPLPFLSFFDATDAVSDPDSFAEAAVPSPSPDGAEPLPPPPPPVPCVTACGWISCCLRPLRRRPRARQTHPRLLPADVHVLRLQLCPAPKCSLCMELRYCIGIDCQHVHWNKTPAADSHKVLCPRIFVRGSKGRDCVIRCQEHKTTEIIRHCMYQTCLLRYVVA
jgi:hypothetical protein